MSKQLVEQFGNIDIYLFDQLQKGRLDRAVNVLDAGCGGGRNLVYLLKNGFNVFATDAAPKAIEQVRALAATLAPDLPLGNFPVVPVEKMPFDDQQFDFVVSNAVLHFARDGQHFDAMLTEMWRVLREGGILFARLASSIGIADRVQPLGNGRYRLPDGSERFLVDEAMLLEMTNRLNASLLDPIKTTNVQNLRCMTTWCVRKNTRDTGGANREQLEK